MATTKVLTGEYLVLGTTDVSAQITEASISAKADVGDTTNHASSGWKESVKTLREGTLTIKGLNSFGAGGIDELLWNAFLSNSATAFTLQPEAGTVSSTNPSYSGAINITEVKPLSGSVGSVASQDVSYAITGVLTRSTS